MVPPPKILITSLLLPFITIFETSLWAQVLCINCFHQNERVLPDSSNLMLNGGFEDGCLGGGYICPNSLLYNCDIQHWSCTGGGSKTYASTISGADPSLVVEGNKAIYFGNNFCNPCSSFEDLSCLEQVDCETIGVPTGYPQSNPEYGGTEGVRLGQTIYGLVPGDIYELEFWSGGEAFAGLFWLNGLFAVNVGFGTIYLQTPPTPAGDGLGIRYVIIFRAVSDSTTIQFSNWGHIGVAATELIIDDVRLLKLPNSGNPCATATVEPEDIQFVKIAPNPFHTNTTIVLNTQELHDAEMRMYNACGNLVRQIHINGEVTEIDRSDLPDGFYMYQVIVDNQVVQTGKLIVD